MDGMVGPPGPKGEPGGLCKLPILCLHVSFIYKNVDMQLRKVSGHI